MRIAVTGGSGALGQALLTQLAHEGADRIVTFSRDEQKRAALNQKFGWHHGIRIMAGDIREPSRLSDMFHGCDVVVHAAARKVVSAHPDEPEEMLRTNIQGTMNVIEAAQRAGVHKVLVISSDKAVRAENVYGVSKAMMEHLAINANGRTWPQGLRISAIRYGNVLASTGSVLVNWNERITKKQPLPMSDLRMTRFWLTLPQAVGYVLKAIENMRGGEIFVPILPAAPITRLAEALTTNPTYAVTGIRPGGEKLHEELLSPSEIRRAVKRNGLYVVPPYQSSMSWDANPWIGEAVPTDLTYNSETWGWQLTVPDMRALVAEAYADATQATEAGR